MYSVELLTSYHGLELLNLSSVGFLMVFWHEYPEKETRLYYIKKERERERKKVLRQTNIKAWWNPRKSWPEKNANQIQGIYYRDITLINLVNCKRIKKGTYIIDCIQLNTWRLNSVNESNIIKELINEPNATVNTKYTYK